MRLRHWRAARRTHPSTAGPPGARRPRTGRRTSRTTSLRQKPAGGLVREGQGIHHAGFFRSCSARPPACQASQRPAESPQTDDACSPAPPRCSHAHNGTRPTRKGNQMSNHFSADNLKFPGDDRRLDLTDVFAFTAPHDPDTTVLIIDSNPTSAPPPIPAPVTGPEFYPGAVYRINIDTDGDNLADVAFTFVFSEYQDGRQTGTAWNATGPEARQPGPAGRVLAADIPVSFDGMAQPVQVNGIRLAAGLRSDPFFADVEGALHGFAWTGHDDFAGNNVDSIALEVPAAMLGGPVIGVWASISRRRDDSTLEQLDRGGNPTINPVINPDGQKNLFNSRQPT